MVFRLGGRAQVRWEEWLHHTCRCFTHTLWGRICAGSGHAAPGGAQWGYVALSPVFPAGSDVPDGCGSAGVRARQQGPAARGRHRAPPAAGLLPVPGALPRRVHARTQARAGMEQWGFLPVSAGSAAVLFRGCAQGKKDRKVSWLPRWGGGGTWRRLFCPPSTARHVRPRPGGGVPCGIKLMHLVCFGDATRRDVPWERSERS